MTRFLPIYWPPLVNLSSDAEHFDREQDDKAAGPDPYDPDWHPDKPVRLNSCQGPLTPGGRASSRVQEGPESTPPPH